MSNQDVIKKKSEDKKKFEVGYFKERLIDFMSYLDLADDDRTRRLYGHLDKTLVELNEVQEVLNGKFVLELPEGFREKMEEVVIENYVSGRDYSDYLRDECTWEVQDMNDEELYQAYEEQHCDWDEYEEDAMINAVKDIISKEKLMEVINE